MPSTILNFKIFIFDCVTVVEFQYVVLCTRFHRNWVIFHWYMAICNFRWRMSVVLNHRQRTGSALALHCCKAHAKMNRKIENSTPCKCKIVIVSLKSPFYWSKTVFFQYDGKRDVTMSNKNMSYHGKCLRQILYTVSGNNGPIVFWP